MGDDRSLCIMLATTDATSREVLGSELRRRYGADYEVVVCADYAHARAVLEGLRRWGRQVALVIGCYGPDDREGLDFLRRAYALHPSAKRVVAAIWGDFASTSDGVLGDRPRARRAAGAAARAAPRRGVPRRPHRRARRLAPRPGRRLRGGAADRRGSATSGPTRCATPSAATTSRSPSTRSGPTRATGCSRGSGWRTPTCRSSCCRSPPRRRRSSTRPTSRSPTPSG